MLLLATLILSAVASVPAPTPDVPAQLEAMTNELLAAIAPGKTDVWQRYAHERLLFVTEDNRTLTKAQLLEEMKPLPKGLTGRLKAAQFKAEVHGNVAVTTYIGDEWLDYYGQVIENDFRITDTWIKTDAGWKLIASQIYAVLEDPPAITLPRDTLCQYNGTYQLTPEITTKIACSDTGLTAERTGRKPATLKAEVRDVFFEPGRPRTRRIFQRDATGAITSFVDRREGLDVRWTRVP
jgi:hypothetical protein